MDEETESWQDTCLRLLTEEHVGLDDMTELEEVNDHTIAENLKIRLMHQQIYTCIGRVLIAVNPFMKLDIYDKRHVRAYHNKSKGKYSNKKSQSLARGNALKCSTAQLPSLESHGVNTSKEETKELPPHIYALTDNMYNNMMIEKENQCVIISGESGAGKTISAKYIMSYLSEIASGGTKKIEEIKNIIIQSNPLLEAFGNAKTLRNNNSSRFGKFVEILFNMAGQPDGGNISNFLLEKSRVVSQNPGERNYHVFYQLLRGCSEEQKEKLGLVETDPEKYYYLNRTGGVYDVPDADDSEEFHLTMNALDVVGMSEELKANVLEIISAILHLGNIQFIEENNVAEVEDPADMIIPSKLLGVDSEALKEKLVSRMMEARWGGKIDIMMMTLNAEQAMVCRDALAKTLYAQLFDYLVKITNSAMRKEKVELCIGVLDIYGFEIFETNGFEQFCINFVNEKLQQIFVELTLKNEQEEYLEEGITWSPIKFFNNKLVCDLIESKNPPGIMSILDDVCFTVHSSEGSDRTLMEKLKAVVGSERLYSKYFRGLSTHFEIHHYAGKVHYEATHFCERNKDVLFEDVIQVMQSSQNEFIRSLFSDMAATTGRRGRSSTGSSKIKAQCQTLIDRIMACTPHYVRCLKPNETKAPLDWHDDRILPQISYLGLRENIDVRRAGFAFRRIFDKIIERYDIVLPKEVAEKVFGDKRNTCQAIMEAAKLSEETWRIGKTKVFMKESDMISKLEQARSDALFKYAAILQSVVRGFLARLYCQKLREQVRAAKIIERAFRRYVGRKNLNYRLLVKQHLKGVLADLEAELVVYSPESLELSEIETSSPRFTHIETTDHIGYYFNKSLQDITGNASTFFTCPGKCFSSTRKIMEKHLLILSMYHFYIIHENSSGGRNKYTLKNKFSYQDLQSIYVSVLDTEFLVLKMLPFDLIWESSHNHSLIAFFLAITSMTKDERPPLEKSDLISVNTEPGKAVSLKFFKEGRSAYEEPRLSKSGKVLTVTIPNMEEVLEEDDSNPEEENYTEQDNYEEDSEGFRAVRKTILSEQSEQQQPHHDVVQEAEQSFTLNIELGKSGGRVSCKGFELDMTESSSPMQTASVEVTYQHPNSSYLESGEILVSPLINVTNMVEQETELKLTIPFLSNLPENVHTMEKWVRFYGSPGEDGSLVWMDIRTDEELSSFMVEIGEGYAKMHTQQDIMFCVVGSRDEEEEQHYNYGSGLEYTTYGDYDYSTGNYDYNTGNYDYNTGNYGEDSDYGAADPDPENMECSNDTFEATGVVDESSGGGPPASLGPPPALPSSNPPRRPFPSPFQDVPLNEKEKEEPKNTKTKKNSKTEKKGK